MKISLSLALWDDHKYDSEPVKESPGISTNVEIS